MLLNLAQLLSQTARQQPDLPAILGPGPQDCLSYAQLDEAVAKLGQRLGTAGIRPGDCVGLHYPSGINYILSTYAVWRCGGCVVPIPVELAAPEKQTIFRTIALPWLVSPPRTMGFAEDWVTGSLLDLGPEMALASLRPQRQHPPGFHAINGAFLRFTSGTTGAAKGVVLSHETIHDRIVAANQVLHIGPQDRVVWLLSMSYHFAVSIVAYLTFGAAVVLPANNLAQGILAAALRHRATLMYGSPIHYGWLASAPHPCPPPVLEGGDGRGPLPDLRLAVSTTTALDPDTAAKFRQRFGLPLTQALGIIEIGLPFINTAFAADRPQALGGVLPAYRLRLDDVGLGEGRGEILLNGKGFLDAYYEPWRPRSEIMPDGWFRTGDVGELDQDGCLFLRGRKKDVIDVLGMKFFPQEVEAVLKSHPAVEGACVSARPDSRVGSVVQAKVVLLSPTAAHSALPSAAAAEDRATAGIGEDYLATLESELINRCKQQLAAFKVPERIDFVPELSRTASGKVLHRAEAARGGGL